MYFPELTILLAHAISLTIVLSLRFGNGTGRRLHRVTQLFLLVGSVLAVGKQVAHLGRQEAPAQGAAVGQAAWRPVGGLDLGRFRDDFLIIKIYREINSNDFQFSIWANFKD